MLVQKGIRVESGRSLERRQREMMNRREKFIEGSVPLRIRADVDFYAA